MEQIDAIVEIFFVDFLILSHLLLKNTEMRLITLDEINSKSLFFWFLNKQSFWMRKFTV